MSKRNMFNFVLTAIFIVILGIYFLFLKGKSDIEEKKEINIDYSNLAVSNGVYTITFPSTLVNLSKTRTQTVEDVVNNYIERNNNNELFESVSCGEDGSIIFQMIEKQLTKWIENTEDMLNEDISRQGSPFEIDISDDFQEATYYVYSNSELLDWMKSYNLIVLNLIKAQIFEGVPNDALELRITIISKETGNIIKQANTYNEEFEITGEEWEKEIYTD